MSVPPAIQKRLGDIFSSCSAFDHEADLLAIFADDRIAMWKSEIPFATTRDERIRKLIEYLIERTYIKGENALVLFLYVLANTIHPDDNLHHDIIHLAEELEQIPLAALASSHYLESLRLDAAVPKEICYGRAFDVATAVRQISSPSLEEDGLDNVRSGTAQLLWSESEEYAQLSIQVKAPECQIIGDDQYDFILVKNQDSPIYYFHLIPRKVGEVSVTVTLFQQLNNLGSARVCVDCTECVPTPQRVAGEVNFNFAKPVYIEVIGNNIGVIGNNTKVEGGIHLGATEE